MGGGGGGQVKQLIVKYCPRGKEKYHKLASGDSFYRIDIHLEIRILEVQGSPPAQADTGLDGGEVVRAPKGRGQHC